MQDIKNLLKIEKNKDILKILAVIFVYIIIFGIFKSGLDYQKVIQPKNYEKPESLTEYEYEINDNGKVSKAKYNNLKSLTQILDGYFDKQIEIRIVRDGTKIDSIYGRKNIRVFVDDKELDLTVIKDDLINQNSKIKIIY